MPRTPDRSRNPSGSSPTPRPIGDPRIFVVDDDPDIRSALSTLLVEEGYQVETFADGKTALAALTRGGADLVILDLRMPGMSGWEFRASQRRDSRVADIPVVAMSADSRPEARAVHADVFMEKPLDADRLLKVVDRLLGQRAHQILAARLAEAERLAELGKLAAGVGHEINNPLTFILANLRLLTEFLDELPPSAVAQGTDIAGAKSMVSESIDGAERIAMIVDGLQALSRQRQGRKTLVEITKILNRALALCEHHTRRCARIARHYGPETIIEGDEGRLVQLFVNILVNAAHALEGGSPAKDVIEMTTRVEGEWLYITVRDTGPGISKDVLPHVFDPFFTTKPEGQGTGLGLAIGNEIAREHGGEILIESAAGTGTTMTVRLSLTHNTRDHLASEPERPSQDLSIAGRRILVVDDEPKILQGLIRLLGSSCTVVTAGDIATAEKIIERDHSLDVILCDVVMPCGGAPALRRWLRERAPDLVPRLLLMTAGLPGGQPREPGVLLYKPFQLRELKQAIARIPPRLDDSTEDPN